LHLPTIVALAIARVRAGVHEYRWCNHTIAAKRQVCRRECAARRSSACRTVRPSCHASTTLLPYNDARLLVGCLVNSSTHPCGSEIPKSECKRAQRTSAQASPRSLEHVCTRVCACVCACARVCACVHVQAHLRCSTTGGMGEQTEHISKLCSYSPPGVVPEKVEEQRIGRGPLLAQLLLHVLGRLQAETSGLSLSTFPLPMGRRQ